jgi:GAF domain-containing protein
MPPPGSAQAGRRPVGEGLSHRRSDHRQRLRQLGRRSPEYQQGLCCAPWACRCAGPAKSSASWPSTGPAIVPFTDDDLRLLSLFANQASVAITNARQVEELKHFHAQQIEKERFDQQMRMAQAVQPDSCRRSFRSSGWDLAGCGGRRCNSAATTTT